MKATCWLRNRGLPMQILGQGGIKSTPRSSSPWSVSWEPPTAKEEKAELRELNATVPDVPQYLDWSEAPITWDREDHPDRVPHPGKYALVIDPIVDNFRLTKVLMDGGSSLNILYEDTLKRMNLAQSQLDYSKVTFHGIVPGRQAKSMGSIKLDVTFGPETNYRIDRKSVV